jgi:parvulin-like peptidyl-prolyl isomerase
MGGTEVTADEVRAYVKTLSPEEQQAATKSPAALAQVVRAYLARQAVLKEAQAKRWDQEPAAKAQLERLRAQALTELYLQAVSQPPEDFPSEGEVQAAYDANRRSFEVPKQYRVAQMFLASPASDAGADEKVRKRTEALSRRLREKGADFAAIARSESEDRQSASSGGEIGWLAEAQMVPGIRRIVSGLAVGGISEPVQLEDGWHVVKLLEVRPPSFLPLAQVRSAIVAQLREERARANRQAYLAKILEQTPPVVNEFALSGLLQGR